MYRFIFHLFRPSAVHDKNRSKYSNNSDWWVYTWTYLYKTQSISELASHEQQPAAKRYANIGHRDNFMQYLIIYKKNIRPTAKGNLRCGCFYSYTEGKQKVTSQI